MKIKEQREKIQELGLHALEEFFGVDIGGLGKDAIKHIHQKARIAMQFEKEINLSQRAIEMNYLRVFRLAAEDKKEIKKLIKKSTTMSKYLV